jgi:hypothetical protein
MCEVVKFGSTKRLYVTASPKMCRRCSIWNFWKICNHPSAPSTSTSPCKLQHLHPFPPQSHRLHCSTFQQLRDHDLTSARVSLLPPADRLPASSCLTTTGTPRSHGAGASSTTAAMWRRLDTYLAAMPISNIEPAVKAVICACRPMHATMVNTV